MSRYDGLIIPRSYNEYINKTDPVAMAQALQLNNVLAQKVAAGNNKAVTSNAVNGALANLATPIKYRATIAERDFNTCISPTGKREIYFIPVANQNNAPIPNYNWILEVDNKNVIPNVSSEYRVSQLATAYSGANPDIKYTRNGSSNDGITWTWGTWQKLTTETDVINALSNYSKIITEQKATVLFDTIKINIPNTRNVNFIVTVNGTTGDYYYSAIVQSYNQGGTLRCHITELQKGSVFGIVDKSNEGYILIPVTQPATSQTINVNILNLSNFSDITIEFLNSTSTQTLELTE